MWLAASTNNKTLLLVLTQILTQLLYRSATMDEKKGLIFAIFTCFCIYSVFLTCRHYYFSDHYRFDMPFKRNKGLLEHIPVSPIQVFPSVIWILWPVSTTNPAACAIISSTYDSVSVNKIQNTHREIINIKLFRNWYRTIVSNSY